MILIDSNQEEKMELIDKVGWVLIREKHMLCVRSTDKTLFYIPGGKREEGETGKDTLFREIWEELSVDVVCESIAYYGTLSPRQMKSLRAGKSCSIATLRIALERWNRRLKLKKWLGWIKPICFNALLLHP